MAKETGASSLMLSVPSAEPAPAAVYTDYLSRLSLFQAEAGKLGLFKTMHALHEANRVGGSELAEHVEKAMTETTSSRRRASPGLTGP